MAVINVVLSLATLLLLSSRLALGQGTLSAALARNRALATVATLQSAISINKLSAGVMSQAWAASSAPRFLAANLEKNQRVTVFLPTNLAYYRWVQSTSSPQVSAACPKSPLSNLLAELMLPGAYTGKQLKALKRGAKLRTLSPLYLTVLSSPTDATITLGIVNGYQKIVSRSNVVRTDAFTTARGNVIVHYVDNVLTKCP